MVKNVDSPYMQPIISFPDDLVPLKYTHIIDFLSMI